MKAECLLTHYQCECVPSLRRSLLTALPSVRRRVPARLALPPLGRPRGRLDRHTAGGDRGPDDGGLPQPEPGRPAGPLHADAGGLRAGAQPAHPHRPGAPPAGQLPPAERGLLPHRCPQAPRQQADGPEAVPGRDRRLAAQPAAAAALHVLQHQELVAGLLTAAQLLLQFNTTLSPGSMMSLSFLLFFSTSAG